MIRDKFCCNPKRIQVLAEKGYAPCDKDLDGPSAHFSAAWDLIGKALAAGDDAVCYMFNQYQAEATVDAAQKLLSSADLRTWLDVTFRINGNQWEVRVKWW